MKYNIKKMSRITLLMNRNKEITDVKMNIITRKCEKRKKHEEIISFTMVMGEEIGENIGGRSNGHVDVLKSTKHINTDRQIIQEST